jgi:hypothetical protein
MLGRVLGGFGAFIAAIIAAAQFVFDGGHPPPTATDQDSTVSSEPYAYALRSDDSGRIRVEVPTAWGSIDGGPWRATTIRGFDDGTPLGARLIAAPSVSAWLASGDLTTPGLFVGVSERLPSVWTPRALAERFDYQGCEYASERPYSEAGLTGWEVRSECKDSETRWLTLAATSTAVPGALVLLQAKLVTPKDDEAYERALATLVVEPA